MLEPKLVVVDIGSDTLNPNLTPAQDEGPDNHNNPILIAADWFRNQGLKQSEPCFSLATVNLL